MPSEGWEDLCKWSVGGRGLEVGGGGEHTALSCSELGLDWTLAEGC